MAAVPNENDIFLQLLTSWNLNAPSSVCLINQVISGVEALRMRRDDFIEGAMKHLGRWRPQQPPGEAQINIPFEVVENLKIV